MNEVRFIQKVFKYRWYSLFVRVLSLLLIGLDVTVLIVALPTIAKELGATVGDLQWITNAYTLVMAAFLLVAGSLGDRFGRKRILFIGFIIFGIASLFASFATTTQMLIAWRALMGIGAAIIMPLTLSMLPIIFPQEERAKAISIWSASSGVGLLCGPILGGWLLEHFHYFVSVWNH